VRRGRLVKLWRRLEPQERMSTRLASRVAGSSDEDLKIGALRPKAGTRLTMKRER
jgi:hypothetical protein